jgi:hypothetical protein
MEPGGGGEWERARERSVCVRCKMRRQAGVDSFHLVCERPDCSRALSPGRLVPTCVRLRAQAPRYEDNDRVCDVDRVHMCCVLRGSIEVRASSMFRLFVVNSSLNRERRDEKRGHVNTMAVQARKKAAFFPCWGEEMGRKAILECDILTPSTNVTQNEHYVRPWQ